MDAEFLVGLAAVIFVAVLLGLRRVRSRDGSVKGVRINFDAYKDRETTERYVKNQDSR